VFEIGAAVVGEGFEVVDGLIAGKGRRDEGDADAEAEADVFGEDRGKVFGGSRERADVFDKHMFDAKVGGFTGDLRKMVEPGDTVECVAMNGSVKVTGTIFEEEMLFAMVLISAFSVYGSYSP